MDFFDETSILVFAELERAYVIMYSDFTVIVERWSYGKMNANYTGYMYIRTWSGRRGIIYVRRIIDNDKKILTFLCNNQFVCGNY